MKDDLIERVHSTAPGLSSTEVNVAMARYLHALGYTMIETNALNSFLSEIERLRAQVAELQATVNEMAGV